MGHKKRLLLFISLLLAVLWTLKKPVVVQHEELVSPDQPLTSPAAKVMPNNELQAISKSPVLIDDEPKKLWLEEIENRIYSADPVIEVASLSMDFMKCDAIGNQGHSLLAESDAYLSRLNLADQISIECEALAAQYPRWYQAKLREKKLLKLQPNSTAGKQLQELFSSLFDQDQNLNYEHYINTRNRLALTIKNAPLTSFAALDQMAGLSFNNEPNTIYQQLLKTQDGSWIHFANELALQSISCTFPNSRSCEPTSFYMFHKCELNSNACGLSFDVWYDQHISAGMKADVLILQNYYRQMNHE